MVIKQWVYREHRIELALFGGDYLSLIYEPGNPEKLSYTPVVEMKHGEEAAQAAAERFVDDRVDRKNPAS
jgi:hypothetical protein